MDLLAYGAAAIGAVTFGLPALGFTAAGIAASSVASGAMSVAAIANGGGVAAGSVMKVLAVFLAVVASVAAQKFSHFANGKPIFPTNNNQQYSGCNSQTLVHARWGNSGYHFSWCADGGRKYDWQTANAYCARLGQGWRGISIESQPENAFVTQTILGNNLEYIWTSGYRSRYDFAWASGAPFVGFAWSHTGLNGQRQPDNRENNAENCLAVLNNFYQDGVVWHDIGCHHTKPIICEKYY